MSCGIYEITNILNNKKYIGSSINLKSREYKHFWMLSKNIHDNIFLQNSYNKYGESNFKFKIIEICNESLLNEKENYYIEKYKTLDSEFGFNLASVNEFRRNNYNDVVKTKLSKYNLEKNNNFKLFMLISPNEDVFLFDNLVEAANYLIENNYAKGKPRNVRMKLSLALRGKKVNNGYNGSVRKTCYKHKFKLIK